MNIAVFNPKSGASGDMVLGCLIGVVGEEKILDRLLGFVNQVANVEVEVEETKRNDITLTDLDVCVEEDASLGFSEIKQLINDSDLERDVKKQSIEVFEVLRDAEENIHGEEAKFHEVGRADALVDIVGSVLVFNELDVEKVYSTTINTGGGFVDTAHGSLPVPTPATEEILKNSNLNWRGGPVDSELLTPTGAALLSYFVDESVIYFPNIVSYEVSRACGDRELDLPNYLSLIIGEEKNRFNSDEICVIETNVDDVDGEIIGYLKERLMKKGALDVSVVSVDMKKNRSGYLVKVLSRDEDMEKLSEILVKELGTLGVRVIPNIHRFIAKRDKVTVKVFGHKIDVKIGYLGEGDIFDVSAEYKDCKTVAMEKNIPLKEVRKKAEQVAREVAID
ncbi:nickel pincer cofactor biosynthesis protein LarC [archaeon SCG-AAA382B04]|nr:nickel pincer cofactor biosynthesis protein LarC [archaeon SCG-AAA382B04]